MGKFTPTDEQWEKMKKHIKSDDYKKEDFFVFETLATGDRIIPNRYTRLMPDLLNVMKDDAIKGVSLMLNHNEGQLGVQSIPIGKVFDARIDGPSQEGETTALYTSQYILKDDSKVDGYSKNDIIKLIETGVLSDTSVGITVPRESRICSICHNPISNWRKCEHIPGNKYIVNEETNEVQQCIVEAHAPSNLTVGNNVLMENSVVFDGAYPNAIIQSKFSKKGENETFKPLEAKQELSASAVIVGYASKGNVEFLYKDNEEKGGKEQMANGNDNEEEVEAVNNEETEVNNQEVSNQEVNNEEVNDEANTTTDTESETTPEVETETNSVEQKNVETMFTEKEILEKFDNIAENIESLIELAKEGLENRNEAIKVALDSGVHAMGNSFNKDVFERTFSKMNTKDIIEMGKAWEEQAKNLFSTTKVSKQVFSDTESHENISVDLKQFKTGLY